MRGILYLAVSGLLLCDPAIADVEGRATAGITDSSGNTDSSTYEAALDLGIEHGQWVHTLRSRGRRSETNGVVTVNRYRVSHKSDFNFTEFNYVFLALEYEQDRPAGVRWRTSETVGYGRRLIKRETLSLDVEVGAGVRQSKSQDTREREDDVIGRFASHLAWEMAEGREFTQDVLVEDGRHNTYVESTTALHTNLVGNVFSEISYTVQRNSNAGAGTENTDRYFSLSLGYDF